MPLNDAQTGRPLFCREIDMFQIMINPMPMSDKPKREYTHDKDYEIRYGNRKESIERSPSCDGSSKLINEGLTVRQPL